MTTSIAIIGAGASGLSLANQIILTMIEGHQRPGLTLTIYEKQSEVGPGTAYGMDLQSNLMNTQVGPLDQGYGEGFGLLLFLKSNPDLLAQYGLSSENLEDKFIPRPLFGLYLKRFAEHIKRLAARNGVGLKIVQDEVRDISYSHAGNRVFVHTVFEGVAIHDYAYLCVGHLDNKTPVQFANNKRFFNSNYPVSNIVANIPKTAPVGILGTRLSAIDTILALKESGHQGSIHCVSRSGRLPAISSITKAHAPQFVTCHEIEKLKTGGRSVSLSNLANMLKAEIALAENCDFSLDEILKPGLDPLAYYEQEVREVVLKKHRPYQAAIHSLDESIDLIWNLTSADERHLFLSRYSSLWFSLWVSIPLLNARKILSHLRSGEVKVNGQLAEHRFNVETSKFELIDRNQSVLAEVDYLINAMGSPSDFTQADDILMSNLLRRRLVRKDPFGGIQLDSESGAIVDPTTGEMNSRLSVIGPISNGTYFFVTVLEIIERHSKARARLLKSMIETEMMAQLRHIASQGIPTALIQ